MNQVDIDLKEREKLFLKKLGLVKNAPDSGGGFDIRILGRNS